MKSVVMALAVAAVVGAGSLAQAAVIAAWNFNGVSPVGGPSPMAATTVDPTIGTPMLARVALGPGDTANFGANKYSIGGDGSMVTATTPDLTKYISFSVTPLGSNMVTIDSVSLNAGIQDNGPATVVELRSSLDAFGAPLLQQVMDSIGGTGGSETLYQVPVNAMIGAANPVEFRIYMYGANNGWETGGIGLNAAGDGLVVNGTTGAVPEPASLGLLGLGGLALLRRRR